MTPTTTALLGMAMGLNLLALGSSRLPTMIRAMAAQGVVLGLLPVFMEHELDWRLVLVAIVTVIAKGIVIPRLLQRAMRAARIEREIEPLVGFVPSLLIGAVGTILAIAIGGALPMLPEHQGTLFVPGSIATVMTGLILLVGRVKAISQVCGYLILENGIFIFGLLLLETTPLLVESGILLDLIVGVFVMGIIVDRIQRAFDSLDTRKLTILRE